MLTRLLRPSKPAAPPGQRVYAVGDVHGRIDLLDRLLQMLERDNAQRDPAQTTIVFLGDLIDRGPASREVVERVRIGVDWAKTTALMGNHEAVMLEALDGKSETLERWLRFGGLATLESWGLPGQFVEQSTRREILCALRDAVTPDERGWLGRLRTSLRIGDYYFVHAGIRPGVPLDKQSDDDRLWVREEFLESRKFHGAMIVHGHSIHATVEERHNRIGLDTGAYASNCLTAMGLEKTDRWYLDTVS